MLGILRELHGNPLQMIRDVASYGDVAYVRIGITNTYFVSNPTLIEEVLLGRHRDMVKDFATRTLMPLVGAGLLTSDGEAWRKQRKLAAPPLQPKRIASYADTMVECAQRMAAGFRDCEVREISDDMSKLTLDIVGRTLLGFDPRREAEQISRVLDDGMRYFDFEMRTPLGMLPAHILTPTRRKVREGRSELEAILLRIIARCRRDEAKTADHFLARLVHARDEDGEAMSDRQLIDEAITMLMAGHETTALALTYALYLLSEHPAALARARAEIEGQLGGRPAKLADVPQLRFIDAVIREALRLYPPAYAMGREVAQPIELAGYEIPRGAQLYMAQYIVHRDPRYFADPNDFKPERWFDPKLEELPRFAYFPFGGGPRVCIGTHFAMLEAALVLTTLLQTVELQTVPGFQFDVEPSITLRPKNGLRMLVRRLRAASTTSVRTAA
jgi:cytochrome P450